MRNIALASLLLVLLAVLLASCTPYVGVGIGATVGPHGGVNMSPTVGVGFHG